MASGVSTWLSVVAAGLVLTAYASALPCGSNTTECQTNLTACASTPCLHEGTCQDGNDSYSCVCAAGYTGSICDTDLDKCESDPCWNNGTCSDEVDGYTCTCGFGFTGATCQTDVCVSQPCQNRGICVRWDRDYTCDCRPGYMGTNCQIAAVNCESDPCLQGGSCTDLANGYACSYGLDCNDTQCGPIAPPSVDASTLDTDDKGMWIGVGIAIAVGAMLIVLTMILLVRRVRGKGDHNVVDSTRVGRVTKVHNTEIPADDFDPPQEMPRSEIYESLNVEEDDEHGQNARRNALQEAYDITGLDAAPSDTGSVAPSSDLKDDINRKTNEDMGWIP